MIRLTWRQFRAEAVVAIVALSALAIVAAITGPQLVHLYQTTVATCAARGDCSATSTAFLRNDNNLRTWLGILVVVGPGIKKPLTGRILTNDCPLLGTGGPGPAGGPTRGPVSASAQQVLHDCVTKVGATFHQAVTYQPANRYWAFQWYELAIFLGAAVVLAGACIWWVRRRLS